MAPGVAVKVTATFDYFWSAKCRAMTGLDRYPMWVINCNSLDFFVLLIGGAIAFGLSGKFFVDESFLSVFFIRKWQQTREQKPIGLVQAMN